MHQHVVCFKFQFEFFNFQTLKGHIESYIPKDYISEILRVQIQLNRILSDFTLHLKSCFVVDLFSDYQGCCENCRLTRLPLAPKLLLMAQLHERINGRSLKLHLTKNLTLNTIESDPDF